MTREPQLLVPGRDDVPASAHRAPVLSGADARPTTRSTPATNPRPHDHQRGRGERMATPGTRGAGGAGPAAEGAAVPVPGPLQQQAVVDAANQELGQVLPAAPDATARLEAAYLALDAVDQALFHAVPAREMRVGKGQATDLAIGDLLQVAVDAHNGAVGAALAYHGDDEVERAHLEMAVARAFRVFLAVPVLLAGASSDRALRAMVSEAKADPASFVLRVVEAVMAAAGRLRAAGGADLDADQIRKRLQRTVDAHVARGHLSAAATA